MGGRPCSFQPDLVEKDKASPPIPELTGTAESVLGTPKKSLPSARIPPPHAEVRDFYCYPPARLARKSRKVN